MSYDVFYTVRKNFKERYQIDTLFFGKKWVYDYKKACSYIFDTYDECMTYIFKNNLVNVHIRRTITHGGGSSHTDYISRRCKYGKTRQ